MVKQIDDWNGLRIEHIGLELVRAATAWQRRLHAEMVERGYAWYGDARAVVAMHLHPDGMPQSELVARVGTTKQAVQQLLDSLEADGVVQRRPDPRDRRSKRVEYTDLGLAAVREANRVKRAIEKDYRKRLGAAGFDELRRALRELAG